MKTTMNEMDCRTFQEELPDLVLTANARPSVAQVAHMRACPPCAEEYVSFQSTFAVMDGWQAPEPSPYFDQKVGVMVREEQAAPKMSWLESLRERLLFNTGRHFRPAMAGVLGLALIAGGGGLAGLRYGTTVTPTPASASATVNDLQILDRNEQAFQQLDELQQDEPSTTPQDENPAVAPAVPPAS